MRGLTAQMDSAAEQGYNPVLLCSGQIRLPLKRMIERSLPTLPVMAYTEIVPKVEVEAIGTVEVELSLASGLTRRKNCKASAQIPTIHGMTLHTLTLHDIPGEASANAGMDAPSETPAEQLRQERVAHAVTRANAEQARRIADCARTSLDTLLLHLDQPCAVVDRNGTVTQWNDGLAALSGIGEEQAVGKACKPCCACLPLMRWLAPCALSRQPPLTSRKHQQPACCPARFPSCPTCRLRESLLFPCAAYRAAWKP